MKKIAFLVATAAALLPTLAHAATPTAPLTRADVEAIVQQYIEQHGDKIMSSVANYQKNEAQSQMSTLITPYSPSKGPATAPVTIVEFSDFQCPFCDRVQPTLDQIEKRYPGKIRWVYKNLPLSFHPMSQPAAFAAMAAQQQGKFWPYSEQLWKRQDFLGDKLFTDIATELKLDMKKFNADRASPTIKGYVENDLKQAEAVGARGTPYFLINGAALSGAQPDTEFARLIEDALKPAASH